MKKILFLIGTMLLLSGCNAKDFSFSGDSDHWHAELNVNQSSDFEKKDFVLKYKGEDINSVGNVAYDVEEVGGFGRKGVTLEENGVIRQSSESDPTNAKMSEDTEVKVTVKWDDQVETFTLEKN
ncbi:membrane lipoprotein lipid attachment site-containing protein [Rossellomorea vietnamensis]|uniref:membrane lipoprotein lipid attachment site-containing protein n=1 Tax=Rossellomorea vietnamensis TaxID=218284 RepID=UPI00308BF7C5|nr:membrane lipoprotein lipid attachment site-containing protein [Rossellomorea vietnamensis]